MKVMIKKIWNAITTLLVVVVSILSLSIVVPKVMNIPMYIVLSGSMEPAYHVGSIVYLKEVETVEVGDVITYRLNNTTVTHRVIEIMNSDNDISYVTKGDSNDSRDNSPVSHSQVIGKVFFTIPYLGFVLSYIQQPPGLYVGIALIISVILMVFLSDLLFGEDKKA